MGRFGARVGPRACLLGGSMKARQKRHKCPKCGKYYVGYPALSREDNETEICPECGANTQYDEDKAEIYCTDCGLVVKASIHYSGVKHIHHH